MALFDFLKRKKEIEKNKEKKPSSVSSSAKASADKKTTAGKPAKVSIEKKVDEVKPEKVEIMPQTKQSKKVNNFSFEVVREPHISEKATYLAEDNKYVFKVYPNTNKFEIKKSVEGIYKVDVQSVNIIKIPRKKRRIGRTEGFRKAYSKAIVTIKEGQKIEIY